MWLAITERYFSDAGTLSSARPESRPTRPATRKGWRTGDRASVTFSMFRGRAIALPDGVRDEGEVGEGHDQVDHDQGDQRQHHAPVDGHTDARWTRLGVEPLPRRDGCGHNPEHETLGEGEVQVGHAGQGAEALEVRTRVRALEDHGVEVAPEDAADDDDCRHQQGGYGGGDHSG